MPAFGFSVGDFIAAIGTLFEDDLLSQAAAG